MLGLWAFVRFLHVLSAAVWVGGQLVVSLLLMPVVRRRLAADVRAEVLTDVGRRFGVWTGAGFLPVQIATGIALAAHHGVTWASLADPGYGRTLAAKLIVFVLVMAAAGGHGIARAAGRDGWARALALASLVGSVVIILLATALATD